MNRLLLIIGVSLAGFAALTALTLPSILTQMGLHPHMEYESMDLSGKCVLMITTSQSQLGEGGKSTGVYASEVTIPYYEFLANGITVDIASMEGGAIPMEPISMRWPLKSWADKRSESDAHYLQKVLNSPSIQAIDFAAYDAIYFAGGWGAAYDLGFSDYLGEQVTQAYANGIILGSVCHGALGLIRAVDEDGRPLLEGRRVTGVTNRQIKELGIGMTPQHPETELRELNALYESRTAFLDTFATHVVVDGTLVTGQNQNSGQEVAIEIMRLLEKDNR
jgi:putative intracellular protease/amidase